MGLIAWSDMRHAASVMSDPCRKFLKRKTKFDSSELKLLFPIVNKKTVVICVATSTTLSPAQTALVILILAVVSSFLICLAMACFMNTARDDEEKVRRRRRRRIRTRIVIRASMVRTRTILGASTSARSAATTNIVIPQRHYRYPWM